MAMPFSSSAASVPENESAAASGVTSAREVARVVQRVRIQAAIMRAGFHLRLHEGNLRSVGEHYAALLTLQPAGEEGWEISMRIVIKVPAVAEDQFTAMLQALEAPLEGLEIIANAQGHVEFRRRHLAPGVAEVEVIAVKFSELLVASVQVHEALNGPAE